MANVNLKTDFKNGETLFDYQLNNNFKAIEAALKAMNAIVWQDNADKVVTFRGTTVELMNREIIDGQILYDTTTGESYIDYEGERISTGSGNAIHIGATEPTNPSTQIWINDDELAAVGSEVVNSLEGNQERMAPSVAAVKEGINTALEEYYSEEEQFTGKYWIDGKKIYRKIINDIEITPGSGKEVVTGITNVDKAIKIEGLFYFDTTRQGITIPSYYTDATFISANFAFDSHNIFYDCAGFNGHGYIAFEYTKTTDTVEESEE